MNNIAGISRLNRFILYGFILILLNWWPCVPALAETGSPAALFGALTGKVEVKESADKAWVAAKEGMAIKPGTTISTGVRAKAIVHIGQSTLTINQLTRMTLEELAEKQGTLTTDLYLKHGQVEAEVKGSEGLKHNFKLRSAVSTAAVRGTNFVFTPRSLWVKEGLVQYLNRFGLRRSVAGGEKSKIVSYDIPQSGGEEKEESSSVVPFTSQSGEGSGRDEPPKAKVTIDFQW